MNIQLNNVLGLAIPLQPTNAGKKNTYVDLLARYDHLANSMIAREVEIPELNGAPDPNNNQEVLQGPQWFHFGVPSSVPARAEPDVNGTQCTRELCICPGPATCSWERDVPEQETEMADDGISQIETSQNDIQGEEEPPIEAGSNSNIFELSSITFDYHDDYDRSGNSTSFSLVRISEKVFVDARKIKIKSTNFVKTIVRIS